MLNMQWRKVGEQKWWDWWDFEKVVKKVSSDKMVSERCWASFHMFVSHLYVFFGKMSSSLAHFLIGSFIFLELSWRSCLYIFEINPLSVSSFAIVFSQSEGCLFTLLIVSFVVQKLLSLIRSHLFIFAFISNILGGGS